MFNLLHPIFSNPSFARRCLVGFLDETVQHDNALTYKGAKEHPRDAFGALEPQFKQALTEGLGMGFAKVWPKRDHSSSEHDVSRREGVGKAQYFLLYRLTVVSDRVIHERIITNMLSIRSGN